MIDLAKLDLCFKQPNPEVKPVPMVVVISGPPQRIGGVVVREDTPENIARIWFAGSIMRDLDAQDYFPMLVLSGDNEQLPMMIKHALDVCPEHLIVPVSSSAPMGNRGNTQSQFAMMRHDKRICHFTRAAVVTSSYHVPRTVGTLKVQWPGLDADVFGVPWRSYPSATREDQLQADEIAKILEYSVKGHLTDPTKLML